MRVEKEEGLSAERIALAVEQSGLIPLRPGMPERFSVYFRLLMQWNTKLNLTAIRSPEQILHRHFLECIFCAQHLPEGVTTLLDYGSGAGFPGVPIALCRPEIRVTLAESQGKKASFLREVVRTLELGAEIYANRVEEMTVGRSFDAVTLRAVDRMQEAVDGAAKRVKAGGWVVLLAGAATVRMPDEFSATESRLPGSDRTVMVLARRDVPRGTYGSG